jgi:hypothetical protein
MNIFHGTRMRLIGSLQYFEITREMTRPRGKVKGAVGYLFAQFCLKPRSGVATQIGCKSVYLAKHPSFNHTLS